MSGVWIWGAALVLYAAFSLWYNNWRGALAPAEVDAFMERLEASPEPLDAERFATMRRFLEQDDGGEFFMVNLIKLHEGEVADPATGERMTPRRLLQGYTGKFMRALFRRAGHPVLVGPAVGGYVEHWGVEKDPGWTVTGVIRYRSRRDVIELVTDPFFEPAHAYKIAAIANTLAFPVTGGPVPFGPRVWVALVLALLAAVTHLSVRLLRG